MTLSSLLGYLAIAAGSTVGVFVLAVVLDDVAGILLAIKEHTFDPNLLPSFLESQFGTVKAAALLGLVATATITAVGSALLHGGLTQLALQGIADAALAAATAGAGAMLLSVVSDLLSKVQALFGAKPALNA